MSIYVLFCTGMFVGKSLVLYDEYLKYIFPLYAVLERKQIDPSSYDVCEEHPSKRAEEIQHTFM